MKYIYPLIAAHISGYTELLHNKEEVVSFMREYGMFYDKHTYWYDTWINNVYLKNQGTHPWIVRDDFGRIVKYDDFTIPRFNRKNRPGKHEYRNGPVPGISHSKPYGMNHTAKKNSGSGHRNRNRAKAIYEEKEYGVKNSVGGRIIPYEGWS